MFFFSKKGKSNTVCSLLVIYLFIYFTKGSPLDHRHGYHIGAKKVLDTMAQRLCLISFPNLLRCSCSQLDPTTLPAHTDIFFPCDFQRVFFHIHNICDAIFKLFTALSVFGSPEFSPAFGLCCHVHCVCVIQIFNIGGRIASLWGHWDTKNISFRFQWNAWLSTHCQ